MSKVRRDEILDYVTYGEQRDEIRKQAIAAKKARRVLVGDELAFLFENRDTVRYQVLEMVRTEQLVKEAEIQHELDTYNELLGADGELGCTLLIGIDDETKRATRLKELLTLPEHIHLEVEGGDKVRAKYDGRQVGEDRVSSVQFLKFDTEGRPPVAMVIDHPALDLRVELSELQRTTLTADLHE